MKKLTTIFLMFAALTLGAQNFSEVLSIKDTLEDGKIEFETKVIGRFTDKKDTIMIELYMTFNPKIKMVQVEGMFIWDNKQEKSYQFVFSNSSAVFKQYDEKESPEFYSSGGTSIQTLSQELKAIRKNGKVYLPINGGDRYIKFYTTGFERIKCEWY